MQSILKQINDPELDKIRGCVRKEWNNRFFSEYFKRKTVKLKKYDPDLLWLLMYEDDYSKNTLKYLDTVYNKYRLILDAGFAQKVVSKGRFQNHVWEMILCDVLSSYGTLIPKGEAGADLLLQIGSGKIIQIEAVTPNEANDPSLQTVKPVYDEDNFFSYTAGINEKELPVVLRFLQGFDQKAKKEYAIDKPLILAINTGQVVGLTTLDDHVLRQALFGIGCVQITYHTDKTRTYGFQQTPKIDKGGGEFYVARFRDKKYSHISGVIYSSRKPHDLTPYGLGWRNSGLVYIPNPIAKHPVKIDFSCMRTITVTEEGGYLDKKASSDWVKKYFSGSP